MFRVRNTDVVGGPQAKQPFLNTAKHQDRRASLMMVGDSVCVQTRRWSYSD